MKKSSFLMLACISVCAMSLTACNDENFTKFQPVDFDVEGVTLHGVDNITFCGEIEADGGEVIFTAKGKNRGHGYLSEIMVRGGCIYDYCATNVDLHLPPPRTVCEEEWGTVEVLSSEPHTTRVVLNANDRDEAIKYEFTFGGAYIMSTMRITQPAR